MLTPKEIAERLANPALHWYRHTEFHQICDAPAGDARYVGNPAWQELTRQQVATIYGLRVAGIEPAPTPKPEPAPEPEVANVTPDIQPALHPADGAAESEAPAPTPRARRK